MELFRSTCWPKLLKVCGLNPSTMVVAEHLTAVRVTMNCPAHSDRHVVGMQYIHSTRPSRKTPTEEFCNSDTLVLSGHAVGNHHCVHAGTVQHHLFARLKSPWPVRCGPGQNNEQLLASLHYAKATRPCVPVVSCTAAAESLQPWHGSRPDCPEKRDHRREPQKYW